MATNVPQVEFTAVGFVAPAASAVLAGVQADWNVAFGTTLNYQLTTPQGQLASSEAAVITNTYQMFVYFTQQLDPAYASGRMQDALARIYFIERQAALPTTVDCLCTGLSGVVIPAGAQAMATDGNIYTSTDGGTIGVGGTVTLAFACVDNGPIACPSGTLEEIYRAIPGWDTITNPDDGVLGRDVEGRAEFEARRAATVANNSVGSIPSVLGAVLDVENVLDAYVTDNSSSGSTTKGGIVLPAHCLFVAVSGGDHDDIARAIWSKKMPGAPYYPGNVTVNVEDSTGYTVPYPTYEVRFEDPDPLRIYFTINIVNNLQIPPTYLTLIRNAVLAAFAGSDGGPRARIGSTLYATRFIAPIAALGTWAQVISIALGSQNGPAAIIHASIAGTVLTVTTLFAGNVAPGQMLALAGAGILAGTMITAYDTGVGGVGTYTINQAQTLAATDFFTVLPSFNTLPIRIDQVPTLDAENVRIILT